MDVPEVARITGATVYGSHNTCELLAILGVPASQICEIHVGDELSLGDFRVTVFTAQHMRLPIYTSGKLSHKLETQSVRRSAAQNDMVALRLRDYVMDECFSFLIRVGDVRLLDWAGVSQVGVSADVTFSRKRFNPRRIINRLYRRSTRVLSFQFTGTIFSVRCQNHSSRFLCRRVSRFRSCVASTYASSSGRLKMSYPRQKC